MLLRYFYDEKLAQASYLVGCQATGEAIVIDPARDVTPYLEAAKKEGVKIVAATETHIHADFTSGARELGVVHGATLYLSDEGGPEWRHHYLDEVNHVLIKDGDRFKIGNLYFQVMHTPGHTPESVSFLLEDHGGNQQRGAMGIFSGDFVFVGDVGRPDLLEKAVGVRGSSEAGARQMFQSLQRFKELPDYLQLWPAHGAGSACGKALGAIPSSTVGYEKQFNWALAHTNEDEFVAALLAGQPEPPAYFAMMKKFNVEGPALLRDAMVPKEMPAGELTALIESGALVIDTRPAAEFRKGHVPGTINIPHNKSFVNWAGWLIDYNQPVYLVTDRNQVEQVLHDLHSIGIDQVPGFFDLEAVAYLEKEGVELHTYEETTPSDIAEKVLAGEVLVIDVRNQAEWDEGHIPGAQHIMLGKLSSRLHEIPRDQEIVLQCQSGARSAIATSILRANGFTQIRNLAGGFSQWHKDGLVVEN
ncbi:MBL fold metallo-hydrolase [Sulfoacidibacillus thermotolerans]|uniref:MBL fold metallo-hydrolase n=1 Tax=Sulfoacidibacillus thermotolerans TaxID=1765684 RepID=A0A2U3DB34_SULT2|nr:MBL fold metallo-hydrolase [Sulfoacidibacillus thermotolerans]PWI58475.1 MBL fold metallo-hydrolase [Sulfoacidibacillus thermotolerans]